MNKQPPILRRDVPFYPSFATKAFPEGEHCVQMCLKMMLAVLMPEREFTLKELEEITHKSEVGGAFSMHFLIWLHDLGFEIKRWDPHDWQAFKREGVEYIRRRLGDEAANYAAETSDIAFEQASVDEFVEKIKANKNRPTVEDAERMLRDGWIVRAPVNSRVLNGKPGYMGHSVIIVGFEDDDVIFHDPGLPAKAYRHESRELFQRAMDSFGGELDAIRPKLKP